MINITQLLRPEQWAKNFFVFLPLFFSGQLLNISLLLKYVVAFFAFSFAASSIYCFNDIYDVEKDRQHPKKCKRPIASGKVSVVTAYAVMAVCFAVSMSILLLFGGSEKFLLIGLIAFYYVMNIAYCVKLKHYVIVDVIVISIGFVLRVLVGGTATGIWLSEWIIMMTFLLALFLAFAKRRDDVVLYQNTGVSPRKNTNRYNLDFMNQIMTVVSTITIIAYIMYTLSPDVIERFHSNNIYITAVFVLVGIIRYLQVTIVDLKSKNDMVSRFVVRDRLQALFSDAVLMAASYAPNNLGNDCGSRHAMGKAKEYGIKRAVIYNETKHILNPMFDLNRQIIKEDGNRAIVIDSANMTEMVQKLLKVQTTD